MKIIPKIILWLTKYECKSISTIYCQTPKSIYPHRNKHGAVIGLLFMNEDEYEDFKGLEIEPNEINKGE